MTDTARKMPDFAGVALVDILANGVAMLIIVVVVSIAARVERDERHAEQADEVAAVMSHKFSTSLVLNSLAASPPAVLHDYDNSPLDQMLDIETLPILELHPGFVREFYSGAVWQRRELLQEFNRMHAWLVGLDDAQKQRVRVDVYDVSQFYLAMSILREHGIRIRHWHFLKKPLSLGAATNCPPGVAAKDCLGGAPGEQPALPALSLDDGSGLGDSDWPHFATGEGNGAGGAASSPGPMPGGVVPGIAGSETGVYGTNHNGGTGNGQGSGSQGQGSGTGGGIAGAEGGELGADGSGLLPGGEGNSRGQGFGSSSGTGMSSEAAAALGSFPNAGEGGTGPSSGVGGGQSGGGAGSGGAGGQVDFRIALPDFVQRALDDGSEGIPALDRVFAAMFHYLGELQDTLDAGGTPSAQVADFPERLLRAFKTPPPLTKAERMAARELAVQFALRDLVGDAAPRVDTLALHPLPAQPGEDALLVIAPNRLLESADLTRGGAEAGELPGHGRIALALNAYPGIWKGLDLRLEPGAVLLMPPEARRPEQMRWRAAAYISPELDDFIIGFVFADIDERGWPRVQADANRVRLDGRPLFSVYAEAAFGARGWLVSLYASLVAGLLLLVLAHRLLAGRRR